MHLVGERRQRPVQPGAAPRRVHALARRAQLLQCLLCRFALLGTADDGEALHVGFQHDSATATSCSRASRVLLGATSSDASRTWPS